MKQKKLEALSVKDKARMQVRIRKVGELMENWGEIGLGLEEGSYKLKTEIITEGERV